MNSLTLYRVVDLTLPHIKNITDLHDGLPLYLCRDKTSWFPSHLSNSDNFGIYEYVIKYNKLYELKSDKNNPKKSTENYFNLLEVRHICDDYFDSSDKCLFPYENGTIDVPSHKCLKLFEQGYDLFELVDPLTKLGEPELPEMFLLNSSKNVLSIRLLDK